MKKLAARVSGSIVLLGALPVDAYGADSRSSTAVGKTAKIVRAHPGSAEKSWK